MKCHLFLALRAHTRPFNGRLSNLDFTEARNSEWQWHQLGYMQVCTSLQTDNHASTPPLSFFTGQMPLLLPNQQHQSTEGNSTECIICLRFGFMHIICMVAFSDALSCVCGWHGGIIH